MNGCTCSNACCARASSMCSTRATILAQQAGGEQRWADLARRRMRADFLRVTGPSHDLGPEYEAILDAYDRAGLPLERALTRLSYAQWLLGRDQLDRAATTVKSALTLADAHGMAIIAADAWGQWAAIHQRWGKVSEEQEGDLRAQEIRGKIAYLRPTRP